MIKTNLISFQHFILILLLLSGCSGISPGINPNPVFKTQPGDQKVPISLYFDKAGKYVVTTKVWLEQWVDYDKENTWVTKNPVILEYKYSDPNDLTPGSTTDYYDEFCYDNTKKSIISYMKFNNTKECKDDRMPLYVMVRSKEKPGKFDIDIIRQDVNGNVPVTKFLRISNIKIDDKLLHEQSKTVKCRHWVDKQKKRIYLIINMIQNDSSIPVGIQFCNSSNSPIRGEISRNMWEEIKNNTWQAELNIFKNEDPEREIALYRTENNLGTVRYEFDLCHPKYNYRNTSLFVNINSEPGDLEFAIKRIKKNMKTNFISFDQMEYSYFTLNGRHPNAVTSKIIDGDAIIELTFPKQKSHSHKKTQVTSLSTKKRNPINKQPKVVESINKVKENFNIGVLPFSTIISDELKSIIQPKTLVNKIRIKVIRALTNKIKGSRIKSVNYPKNTAPFTQETIDLIAPTLKKDIKNTPLFILEKICKRYKQDKIIIGHFEENLINNQLDICLRLYDCSNQEMISFSQHIDLDSQQTITEKDIDDMINSIGNRLNNGLKGFTI